MIIVLNGPPGCGKDTIAKRIAAQGWTELQFKEELYAATAEHFGVSPNWLRETNEDRSRKERPLIGCMSVREMLIYVSENVIKPEFGPDHFGLKAAERAAAIEGNVIFSDGGFLPEFLALPADTVLVRLHRDGFTFAGDSRSYIYPERSADVYLYDGDIDRAVMDVLNAAYSI